MVAALAGDHAGAARRDQGPPAAALCAVNRDLLASAQRRRQLVPSVPGASSGTTAALGRDGGGLECRHLLSLACPG